MNKISNNRSIDEDVDMMLASWRDRSHFAGAEKFDARNVCMAVRAKLAEPEVKIYKKSLSFGMFRFSLPKVVSAAAAMFLLISGVSTFLSGSFQQSTNYPYYAGSDGSVSMSFANSSRNVDLTQLSRVALDLPQFTTNMAPFDIGRLSNLAEIKPKVEHVWVSNGEISNTLLDKLKSSFGATVTEKNGVISLQLKTNKRDLSRLVDSLNNGDLELLSSAQPQPLQGKFAGNADDEVVYNAKIVRP